MHERKGFFIVIDGPDGAGKEVAARTIVQFLRETKPLLNNVQQSIARVQPTNIVFDLDAYWQRHHHHPQFEEKYSERGDYCFDYLDPEHFDIIIASEPTHTGIGQAIRNEIVHHKGKYNARFTAEMFAADRFVLYKRVLLPALERGKTWIQQRSFSTSIVYQQAQAQELSEELNLKTILSFQGNQLAQEHPPDLLILPIIKNVERILARNKQRAKDDRSFFESVAFQKRVADTYASTWLKEFFEKLGTAVEYVDGELSMEAYQDAMIQIIKKHYPKIK